MSGFHGHGLYCNMLLSFFLRVSTFRTLSRVLLLSEESEEISLLLSCLLCFSAYTLLARSMAVKRMVFVPQSSSWNVGSGCGGFI